MHRGRVERLSFYEHVKELRKRLTWSAGVFIAGGLGGYVFREAIIAFLKKPIEGPLYYNTPAGNFDLVMSISMLVGAFVALPVLIYNIIRYVEPAVAGKMSHRSIVAVSLLALILAALGVTFGLYVVLPMSIHFFQSFKIPGLNPLITANSYLDFVLKCLLAFMFMFQMPLVILFINRITPLKPRTLWKYERHVIVGSVSLALILPFSYDPITQFVIAAPIVILYNLSILLLWLANRNKKRLVQPQAAHRAAKRPIGVQPRRVTPITDVLSALTEAPATHTAAARPVAAPMRQNVRVAAAKPIAVLAHSQTQAATLPVVAPQRQPRVRPRPVRTFQATPHRRVVDIAPVSGARRNLPAQQNVQPQPSSNFLDLRLASQESAS